MDATVPKIRRWDICGSCAVELPHTVDDVLTDEHGHTEGWDHAVDRAAFDKTVEALRRISKTRTRDPLAIEYRKIARETLKELGLD